MGIFTLGEVPQKTTQPEHGIQLPDGGYSTDIEGVKADGYIQHGAEKLPVFNVDGKEFYQNVELGRNKIRFTPDSNVDNYIKKSTYNKPFFLRYSDDRNEFIKKVK